MRPVTRYAAAEEELDALGQADIAATAVSKSQSRTREDYLGLAIRNNALYQPVEGATSHS